MKARRLLSALLTFSISVSSLSLSYADSIAGDNGASGTLSQIGPAIGESESSMPVNPAEETLAETLSETKSADELWLEQQLAEQARLAAIAQHAADIGNYYKDAVLIGDSVAMGFSLYAAKHSNDPIFQNLKFLTRGSYSVHNAFSKITSKSTHPVYLGQQRHVWESISLMGAKHVYCFFGLNDLYAGVDDTVQKYLHLLDQITATNPGVDFTIISTTPMYNGSEKKNLNNANIRALNATMAALAETNGWGYVDIATPLSDANGCLASGFCSDHYVHQTNSAYAVWKQVLENYAEAHLTNSSISTAETESETTAAGTTATQ
ncbi:GDSL-type esterase/lipase family protein [Oribacterium sp. WCC10]|uniref:GDSL-type esterase/lipase family protein n=1 Tax=Oribacterium sp. WCC10 TaxID=1855343 RepID=UPI0008F35336|nr:GDSL-type esterase/lipase family protein [Oribacterium sp. WCC10]SFG16507.1 GDSL-like Lipase/Acylhydrolase family protein [Oribacterium sp. WCC10]